MISHSFRQLKVTLVYTLLYRAVLLVPSLLPPRIAVATACRIGRAKYRRMRPTLESQSSNMQHRLQVGPDVTHRILARSYELEACEVLEGALTRFRPKTMLDLTEIRGLEHLTDALDGGNGAILYSGHIRGNFSFFSTLGALGLKPNIIRLQLREMQHPIKRWFTDRFNSLLEEKFACRFLWTQPDSFGVAVQAANALRKNEVVLVLVDLSFSAENVEVDFLGGRARFPAGPALLAEATGAPLLDYYIYRSEQRPTQTVEIGEPAVIPPGRTPDAIQECATRLERHIRRHPAGWSAWLIQDWKHFATWNEDAPWTFLREATNRW